MKFLDAQRKAKALEQQENKMMPGSREDQGGAPTKKVEPPENKQLQEIDDEVVALADRLNIDLSHVQGSGRDGKITKGDVRKHDALRASKDVSR